MESAKVKRASFSLEDEYHDLFRKIAKRTRRSMTDELRMMIDARAVEVGLEPLGDVDIVDDYEDLRDAALAKEISDAVDRGEIETVSWEEVKAALKKKGLLNG